MKKKLHTLVLFFASLMTYAQVGINTTLPDPSSVLDIVSTTKGLLPPRVNLTSTTVQIGTAANAAGLLVYNTGTALPKGYYFWNGTEWRSVDSSSAVNAIATLNCSGATLDPQQTVTGGTPLVTGTVLKIPYTAGNGGKFTGTTLSSVGNPAVTATITDNKVESGSASLSFSISGTPNASQTSPAGITFDLTPFLTLNSGFTGCSSITVGKQVNADIKSLAVMDYLKFITDTNGTKGFSVEATTPDGLYTFRVFLRHSDQTGTATATNNTNQVQNADVQIRNNSAANKILMWNNSTEYGAYIGQAGNTLTAVPNLFGGDVNTGNTWSTSTTAARVYWGDAGIYQGSNNGPEYRYYSWIDTSNTTKVAYTAYMMAGAVGGQTATNPATMKVFIKIDQITAP
ncbi:hypothetical protein NZD88_01580 [Chryseobacterium antibioticum]|uniref:Uncharacterized protein n=1 Tax=Chryseobacterium pyrolae TaxID=2987481 RepID=A0ABT2ICD5_9FLAO|nr:hypothetical protein [Chryseobacterium pyrolae]MCT2406244.1 hypothetical protein [Chryseobacterium pyrolae]